MEPNPLAVFPPATEIFPDITPNFATLKTLLNGLSRTDLIFWCGRINLILSNSANPDFKAKQEYVLQLFFTPDEINKINRFAIERGGISKVRVFSRGTVLDLLRYGALYCQDRPEDEEIYSKEQNIRKFARCLAVTNELWSKNLYGKGRMSLEDGIEAARLKALGAIRKGIEASETGPNVMLALGRGSSIMCEYFPRFYRDANAEFQSIANLSLEDYYVCMASLIPDHLNISPEKALLDPTKRGIFDISCFAKTFPSLQKIFNHLIALESQTVIELSESLKQEKTATEEGHAFHDSKALRRKPLLSAVDGRALVGDPVYFIDKLLVGPIFHILRGNEDANRVFGEFGRAFEQYASDILAGMFPSETNRLKIDVRGKDRRRNDVQIFDASLEYPQATISFEFKAAWINEEKILPDQHEVFLEHIRDKYGVSSGSQERLKGVAQLARSIANLSAGEWDVDDLDLKSRLIFPVLLVHDSLFDAPAYGNFLAIEFEKALQPDEKYEFGIMKKGALKIVPLILMTIEDLENLEQSVQTFSLYDLLYDYAVTHDDRIVSLHNFMASSQYRDQLHPSKRLLAKATNILDKLWDMIQTGIGDV